MKLSDFDYDLPPEFIAQHPLEQRDQSRLMVVDRNLHTIEHRHFYDLTDYVNTGDTLVFNNSRVIPARLKGTIASSQRQAEILLLKQLTPDTWEALVRPGRKLFPGSRVLLKGEQFAVIIEKREAGIRVVKFSDPQGLDKLGEMPLPPYIKAKLQAVNATRRSIRP